MLASQQCREIRRDPMERVNNLQLEEEGQQEEEGKGWTLCPDIFMGTVYAAAPLLVVVAPCCCC